LILLNEGVVFQQGDAMNLVRFFAALAVAAVLSAGSAKADYAFSYQGVSGYPSIQGTLTLSGNAVTSAIVTSLTDGSLANAANTWVLDTTQTNTVFPNGSPTLGDIYLKSGSGSTLETIHLFYNQAISKYEYSSNSVLTYGTTTSLNTTGFTITSTPEPTSMALLAAGAPCLMMVRRLRRKA